MERLTPEEELKRLLLSSELDLLAELQSRLGEIQARVGDDEVLQETLRNVIVDVLRDAGTADHERLSTILAPLMLSSLRAEIRSSRDMMVEALYPITGRLVSAAVKNAFRDMLQNLDSRVTETFSLSNLGLRVRALFSRHSYGELLLRRSRLFHIEETLVIHRPTGLLISRVASDDEAQEEVDRDLVGSMLNAVMSLSRDAFGDETSGELSTLEFGDAQLYVKSSPTIIVVVVARGAPPAHLASDLDELFVSFLEAWGTTLSDFDGELSVEHEVGLASDIRHRLGALLEAPKPQDEKRSVRRPAIVLSLALAALVGWMGWRAREAARIDAWEAAARDALDLQASLAGYPIDIEWDERRNLLVVRGLTPAGDARDALQRAVDDAVEADVEYVLRVLPDPTPPPDPVALLERFAQLNAIYFEEGYTPRDPGRAETVLQQLASHLLDTPDNVRLRIIGYADPLGSPQVNAQLTLDRARFAYERLAVLGVSESRMVIVGRPGERLATQTVGAGSDSRRTEFEVYFTEG